MAVDPMYHQGSQITMASMCTPVKRIVWNEGSRVHLRDESANLDLGNHVELQYRTHVLTCTPAEFDAAWHERPNQHIKFNLYGRVCQFQRYVAMYRDKPYRFSGTLVPARRKFSVLAQRAVDTANRMYPGNDFNQVLVNWYVDGQHYISRHRDDEAQHREGKPIVGFNVYENPADEPRIFRNRKYAHKGTGAIVADIRARHGAAFTMIGMQKKNYA